MIQFVVVFAVSYNSGVVASLILPKPHTFMYWCMCISIIPWIDILIVKLLKSVVCSTYIHYMYVRILLCVCLTFGFNITVWYSQNVCRLRGEMSVFVLLMFGPPD